MQAPTETQTRTLSLVLGGCEENRHDNHYTMRHPQCTRVQLASMSDLLVGLVVKASTSRAEDPGFESRWRRDFFGVESYQ